MRGVARIRRIRTSGGNSQCGQRSYMTHSRTLRLVPVRMRYPGGEWPGGWTISRGAGLGLGR